MTVLYNRTAVGLDFASPVQTVEPGSPRKSIGQRVRGLMHLGRLAERINTIRITRIQFPVNHSNLVCHFIAIDNNSYTFQHLLRDCDWFLIDLPLR